MTKERIKLGKEGEKLAIKHLKAQGCTILQRNYRQKAGEIDIIAEDADSLVFVEVKTRRSLQFGQPYEAVTHHKQQQLQRVAQDYLSRNGIVNRAVRFDVISILLQKGNTPEIVHLQNCI